jgi:DNA-directed RNA polymerase specialized sigma24 family protein
MSDTAQLLREADEAFADLHRAIDGLTEDQLLRAWLGTWSIREILIHISAWHRVAVPAFDNIARGESPYPKGTYDDFDTWNARFVADKAGAKLGDVLAELDASRQAFMAAAKALPPQHLAAGGGARELFEGIATGHYREHTAQIQDWRRTAGR